MRLHLIQNLPTNSVSLDFETDRIQPGLKNPPAVVGSLSWLEDGPAIKGVLPGTDSASNLEEILNFFQEIVNDEDKVLVGANIAMFDLLVAAIELAKRGTDIMPALYKMLEQGRVFDIQIAHALHDIAEGILGIDPRTNQNIINPETGIRGRYSLAYLTSLLLDRSDAKANAKYKEGYADLRPLPFSEWPPEAVQYPIDDTNNTHECALAQTGHWTRTAFSHDWGKGGSCLRCGSTRISAKCYTREANKNLHDLAAQTYTAFAMHMGASRGFRVNQASVDIVEKHARWKRERLIPPFIEAGIIRADGTVDEAVLKKKVAMAYGAKDPCPVCNGTGKVPSPEQPMLRCGACKGRCQPWKAGGKIKDPTVEHCPTCNNTGKVPHHNPRMIGCVDFDANGEKLKTCDGTGLYLTADVPRSDKDGIGKGKDPCHESGDEFLMSYGDFLEDAKLLKDYIPYLREARLPDGTDIPLTLRPNPVLETGRTSYNGYIQTFPRKPGYFDYDYKEYVPSIRECLEPRKGYLFASVDYDSGEVVTHAQSLRWIVGRSRLAEDLIRGLKPHSLLGAAMVGLEYDEFNKRLKAKDKAIKNARQAAKPGVFGLPGGIGPVKLTLQQRQQGPDTPHESGPNWIKDEDGKLIRGYKGLRFCILMNDAPACGREKTTRWRDQTIKPTCVECIECAIKLKQLWIKQWPENREYFEFINNCVEFGQQITSRELDRWPWLKEIFAPGTQLAPGQIMQHHSGRIRGGLEYSACANGYFQALLGDAAKSALCRISRECYDKTCRVPELAHENSVKSQYAGMDSPLYGSHVIVFLHDEILPEVPESQAHDAAMRVSEIMVEEMMYYCPDLAPAIKAPPCLMGRWYKGADPVFNAAGKLIPWEPSA